MPELTRIQAGVDAKSTNSFEFKSVKGRSLSEDVSAGSPEDFWAFFRGGRQIYCGGLEPWGSNKAESNVTL